MTVCAQTASIWLGFSVVELFSSDDDSAVIWSSLWTLCLDLDCESRRWALGFDGASRCRGLRRRASFCSDVVLTLAWFFVVELLAPTRFWNGFVVALFTSRMKIHHSSPFLLLRYHANFFESCCVLNLIVDLFWILFWYHLRSLRFWLCSCWIQCQVLLDFVDCDRFQWWIVVVTASAIDELEAFSVDSVLI